MSVRRPFDDPEVEELAQRVERHCADWHEVTQRIIWNHRTMGFLCGFVAGVVVMLCL